LADNVESAIKDQALTPMLLTVPQDLDSPFQGVTDATASGKLPTRDGPG
jgi:hypothetical protein